MKQTITLQNGWSLHQIPPQTKLLLEELPADGWLSIRTMPAQVHDILLDHDLLPQDILLGWAESAEWIGEYDWVYRCEFEANPEIRESWLFFAGIDTVADIYLNGKLLASHDDFYLSQRIPVTDTLRTNNTLLIHFHNIMQYLEQIPYPEEWQETVTRCKLVRKPIHDFPSDVTEGTNYQGAKKYYSPIGLYRDVSLIQADQAILTEDWIESSLDRSLAHGKVEITCSGKGWVENLRLQVSLLDPQGRTICVKEEGLTLHNGIFQHACTLEVKQPALWWPREFGDHPLYTVQIDLVNPAGAVCDRLQKQVGFRHIEMPYPLSFIINGKKIRMWGGSMDPLQGWTHCVCPDRITRLLDMIENAHMNTLRVWGEGIPQPDLFYEECDRRGILVWQEFFLGFGAYPNTPSYRQKCREEAEELVKRLRHHTCLVLWCGGNETIMGSEFLNRKKPVYGIEMLEEDFPRVLAALDPGRYYHKSSPSGGEWANDPRTGDHHTYDCIWYYPYQEYPNFVSEHIRTAPPVLHSLKKIIRGELWPEGYDGRFLPGDRFPMPQTWMERSNYGAKGDIKTGPYWEYYDADNAYDMVYRFAASYAQEMRDGLERVRMGGPDGNTPPARRCKGHFSCKLNDTWPKVYCAVIDFFQEGFMPYYATLRAQEPVLVCFDVKDEIRLWLVNDSPDNISGTITFGLFDIEKNAFVYQKQCRASMRQGDSNILFDLNDLHFFPKNLLLYASFEDDTHTWKNVSIDYLDIERHYRFPEAVISAQLEGDTLVLETDRFARCVEITGDRDGDPFGWLFSDNYFDLIPGEKKRVRIISKISGEITIKAHYSPSVCKVMYSN